MKGQRGQSTVEYVLLLSVVMLFVAIVMRSPIFQDLLGDDSDFFTALRDRMEYNYRYTHIDEESNLANSRNQINNAATHPSYSVGGRSRFAGLVDPYGE